MIHGLSFNWTLTAFIVTIIVGVQTTCYMLYRGYQNENVVKVRSASQVSILFNSIANGFIFFLSSVILPFATDYTTLRYGKSMLKPTTEYI